MSVSASDLQALEVSKYLAGVGVTLVLYDHLLNLPREIQYVWQEPPLFLAICVLADVYLREAGLIYFAVVLSGIAPMDRNIALTSLMGALGDRCASFTIFAVVYGLFSNASVHSYILFRLYRIWDDRKFVKYVLGVAFFICMAGTIVSDGYVLKQLTAEVQYVHFDSVYPAATCVFPKKSWYLIGSWAGMVAFDLFALSMVLLSSLMTPRRPNTAIVGVLYKQGFYTFLVRISTTTAVKVAANNLWFGGVYFAHATVSSAIYSGAISTMYITSSPRITWALDGILSFRLFLKIKQVENSSRRHWSKYDAGSRNRSHLHIGPQLPTILVFEEIEMDLK
ncbi:uncharacterized protein C8Q71DRAFT_854765 [Rhodofomes roseus]|uniref:DUF6533 domain-containing protein n=1 Tax=Rhodofomes roseus TaxID=34475 RepID=A0ABQ8KRE1_9APHY|nr:uncharacterized protein C8Q71DRAFT_854765 [Rhodofomes roseus]KAH9840914.1 hypothetical protein C8Q71DRAFT_854765 [Rhodofomes roseus]